MAFEEGRRRDLHVAGGGGVFPYCEACDDSFVPT